MHEHLICTFAPGRPIKISMSSVSCGSIDGSNIPQSPRCESSSHIKCMYTQASAPFAHCTQTQSRNDAFDDSDALRRTPTHAYKHGSENARRDRDDIITACTKKRKKKSVNNPFRLRLCQSSGNVEKPRISQTAQWERDG